MKMELLGLILVSFFATSFALIPFIDLLFYLKRRYKRHLSKVSDISTPIHNKILAGKDIDIPVGGGLLVIPATVFLSLAAFVITNHQIGKEIIVLVACILLFGSIGLLDDLKKLFISFSGKYAGIRARYLLLLQVLFALLISLLIYFLLGYNNIYIPVVGNIVLGWLYVPLSMFAIVSFANAYNISDGLDGLSTGLLVICLFAFLALAQSVLNTNLSIFIGVWIGALMAYLYFNVFPARVYLGDAGAYGFGATLAVVGLLTGKIVGLGVIGGVYVLIILSSLLQILSKRVLHRKIFPVAPLHMYFKYIGWEEPKIVTRFWLAGIMFAIFGLWLAFLSR